MEEFQKRQLIKHREELGLAAEATIEDVIEALAEAGRFFEATELLFGCNYEKNNPDHIGRAVYAKLRGSRNLDLLKAVARHHFWWPCLSEKGPAFRVDRGRFLVLKEPAASLVLKEVA